MAKVSIINLQFMMFRRAYEDVVLLFEEAVGVVTQVIDRYAAEIHIMINV